MIILHVAESFGSGVFNYIRYLCKWQCQEHEIVIAYGVRPETPENIKDYFDDNVRFIEVDGFTREIIPSKDIKAFINLRKIVNDVHPDLIHLHSTKAGVIGRWCINTNKYKVLYSPHAYSFLMKDCSEFKRKIYKFIERISDRKNCITIADVNSEYFESLSVSHNHICIENGLNLEEMEVLTNKAKQMKSKYKKNKIRVCMIGKAVPQKNPVLFNEIALANNDYEFLWIGDGELRECLNSPNITVTGWLNRIEALTEVNNSDIFMFTSSWESLSIALLEAMYLKKPCIVSGINENKDIISSGIDGFVCNKVNEYTKALEKLSRDKELQKRFSENSRKKIDEIYNTKQIENKYKELYKKIFE